MDLEKQIKNYTLPPKVLPLAPRRQLFSPFDTEALSSASRQILLYPEKRGPLSHAVRAATGTEEIPTTGETTTIEAHFDSVAVNLTVGNELIRLGFEVDGFYKFNPLHYGDHYTLKFKVANSDVAKRKELHNLTRRSCDLLIDFLKHNAPSLECYLELEIYSSENRITFKDILYQPWNASLLAPIRLKNIEIPTSKSMAKDQGIALDLKKAADIHIKLDARLLEADRNAVVALLLAAGFYEVITWSGNTVCTGQFASAKLAKETFQHLAAIGARLGGIAELTMEPCPFFWRSEIAKDGDVVFAAVPPILYEADM